MDMVDLAKQNDGVKYVLVCVDIFSRYAHRQPTKRKRGEDVLQALKLILSGTRKAKTIRSDLGQEFRNKQVNAYLKSQNIHHFYALNTETKAERLIKTLKHKLFRYMLKNRTQCYIEVLQDVVYSYNHTVNRSLGQSPASITKDNEGECRLQQYLLRQGKTKRSTKSKQKASKKYKYNIDQTVRLSHVKSVFDREYS